MMRLFNFSGFLMMMLITLFSTVMSVGAVYAEDEENSFEEVLSPGSSYIIENQSNEQQWIRTNASSSNGDYFDYAVYTGEGQGHSQGASATRSISIPSGGSAVVTIGSDSGNVTVEWDEASVSIASTSEPALYHMTLESGESYEFVNHSADASYRLLSSATYSNDQRYDYAVYEEDGSGRTQRVNTNASILIRAGETAIVTPTEESPPVTFSGYHRFFDGVETDEPALYHMTLESGESYEFVNHSGDASYRLQSSATYSNDQRYDYAVYEEDGSGRTQNVNTNANILIRAGETAIVTPTEESPPVTFSGYHRFFDGVETDEPALYHMTVEAGESYEFVNHSADASYRLQSSATYSNDQRYDYAVYEEDGSGYAQSVNSSANILIRAGGTAIVTLTEESPPVTFSGYHRFFDGVETDEPALYHMTVEAGESYEFVNHSADASYRLLSSATYSNDQRYDYAVYEEDGSGRTQRVNTNASILIRAGETAIVTPTEESPPVTFSGYYRFFAGDPMDESALNHITLQAGAHHAFHNSGERAYRIQTRSAGDGDLRYDYAVYREDGSGYRQRRNSSVNIYIPAGGTAYVSLAEDSESGRFSGFETMFQDASVEEPALYLVRLDAGGEYTFTNRGQQSYRIQTGTIGSDNTEYAYDSYRNDGSLARSRENTSFSSILVPAGGKVEVRVNSNSGPVIFGGYYDFFGSGVTSPTWDEEPGNDSDDEVADREANYDSLTIGQLGIKGDFENIIEVGETVEVKSEGTLSINDFLYFKGDASIDLLQDKLTGDGVFYVSTANGHNYYLYEGEFELDGDSPGFDSNDLSHFRSIRFQGVSIDLNKMQIHKSGLSIEGEVTLYQFPGFRDQVTVDINELGYSLNDGLLLDTKVNAPDFKAGPIGIENSYLVFNYQKRLFGGGGEVKGLGTFNVGVSAVEAHFRMKHGKLDSVTISGSPTRPIPLGQSGFGIGKIGGSLSNLTGMDPQYGTTFGASMSISDMFSPEFKGQRLINANDLSANVSNMHIKTSGRLNIYDFQLASAESQFHRSDGFFAKGDLNVLDFMQGETEMKKPLRTPFNGYGRLAVEAPEDWIIIGGRTFNEVRMDIDDDSITGSVTVVGIPIGIRVNFEDGSVGIAESHAFPSVNQYEGNRVILGDNFSPTGTHGMDEHQVSLFSMEDQRVDVPLESHEAVLLEITNARSEEWFSVVGPDGRDYELNFDEEEGNALLDEDKERLYVSILDPENGDWTVKRDGSFNEVFNVTVIDVNLDPSMQEVEVLTVSDEHLSVKWDGGDTPDTSVSLYISDDRDSYTGYLMAEGLDVKGEETFSIPEGMMTGDYYLFAKAEREGNAPDWLYAERSFVLTDLLAPEAPKGLVIDDIGNGKATLSWSESADDGIEGYLVAKLADGELDYEDSVYVTADETQAEVRGWPFDADHSAVVVAVSVSNDGQEDEMFHFSQPSNPVTLHIPTPVPPEVTVDLRVDGGSLNPFEEEDGKVYYTDQAEVQLQGESGESVNFEVIVNDEHLELPERETLALNIELNLGTNDVEVIAVNKRGDKTVKRYAIHSDLFSPLLHIDTPADGATIESNSVYISGHTEAGTDVFVNGEQASVSDEGLFELTVETDKVRDDITIVAQDRAGNRSTYEALVTMINDQVYTDFGEEEVEPDKEWTIAFNQAPLNDDLERHVYVLDAHHRQVDVTVEKDGDKLMVRPVEEYVSGERYRLVVEASLKSKDGEALFEGVQKTFVIE
ncbi:fibronectin type III domain-containing protein [Salisediminibacterium selenitireducens]|nr:fibronectin type III domain-containing protein [Salisediminibacterium selenitireducens]